MSATKKIQIKVHTKNLRGAYAFLIGGFLLFSISLSSCIEQFNPDIDDYEGLIVINGSIIKGDSLQEVTISNSSNVNKPELYYIEGCEVYVTDSIEGNSYYYKQASDGKYKAVIPKEILSYENTFQLFVKTPENKTYRSDKIKIQESSPIDSLYYSDEMESATKDGLQFYIDLKAPDSNSKYYMWKLEETWEIHTLYPLDGYWEKGVTFEPVYHFVSDSIDLCWSTEELKENYTSSTENLIVNEKKRIPLNLVHIRSTKLNHRYSLLVKQYALSRGAYQYHNQRNAGEQINGLLYDSQPAQSYTNISNIDNPEEVVLGYFWGSSYSEKRIFFTGPLFYVYTGCDLWVCGLPDCDLIKQLNARFDFTFLVAIEFNATHDTVLVWAFPTREICIDCTVDGASTIKPDFWNN